MDGRVAAALGILRAVIETIRETPGGVPAGILYAGLMTKGCSLQQYEAIEARILGTGLVKKSGDVLNWVGA